MTKLGGSAFEGCTNLISAFISNNVTEIEHPFANCPNLKTLYLGKSVDKIRGFDNLYNPFRGCDNLTYFITASDKFPGTYFDRIKMNCRFIMKQSAYDAGIPYLAQDKYATYSNEPVLIEIKSLGATSATFNVYPIDEDCFIDEQNMKVVRTTGLTPEQQLTWKLDDENYGILSDKTNKTLTLTVQDPKALSTKKARLLATAEESDDVQHFGFEWRRYDAPDGVQSSKVSAPLYNGTIVGTLSNLKDDVYYKYRPFYKSDSGETFYGEWMGLFTGDADVYFEPEVYTKDAEDITKVSALLAGVWFEGTDDIQEKGFEYWAISNATTRAVGADVKKVTVSGNTLTTTLDGLKAGATYVYRSYAKTASGTTYGEEKTFKTKLIGDVDGDGELTKADAKAIADYIVGNTPAGFNKKMADMNDDKVIDATDIVLLVNLIK